MNIWLTLHTEENLPVRDRRLVGKASGEVVNTPHPASCSRQICGRIAGDVLISCLLFFFSLPCLSFPFRPDITAMVDWV